MKKKRSSGERRTSRRQRAPERTGNLLAKPPRGDAEEPTPALLRRLRSPLVVLAAVLFVHARTLGFGFVYLDDTELIVDRLPFLRQWSSLVAAFRQSYFANGSDAYYRPLVTVSYALDAHLSGANSFGYHLTNLLLHAGASLLVLVLLRRLRFTEPIAILGAVFFAVHPALVETVAWIPGRNDLLLAVFALGAWILLEPAGGQDDAAVSSPRCAAHVVFLWAALLTKETAFALPFLYAAHIGFTRGLGALARSRLLLAAWGMSLGFYLVVRAAALAPAPVPFGERVTTVVSHLPAVVSSLGKLMLPVHLAVIAVPEDTPTWPGVLAVVGIGAAFFVKGARRPMLGLAVAALVIPLLPAALASEHLVLENRLYVPAIGLVLFVAEICRGICIEHPERLRWAAVPLAVAAVAASRQGASFRDRSAFTAAAIDQSPHSALAHLQRGVFLNQVDHDGITAERQFNRAAELDPSEPLVNNNLGVLLLDSGQLPEAEAKFRAELAAHPKTSLADYNLGLALRREGHFDEAVHAFERALEDNPDNIDAMGELYAYCLRTGSAEKSAVFRARLEAHGLRMMNDAPH